MCEVVKKINKITLGRAIPAAFQLTAYAYERVITHVSNANANDPPNLEFQRFFRGAPSAPKGRFQKRCDRPMKDFEMTGIQAMPGTGPCTERLLAWQRVNRSQITP